MKKQTSLKEKITGLFASISTAAAFFVATAYSAYADTFQDAANGAAEGISNSGKGVVKPLLIIALVIGGLLIAFGTQRQAETVKERAPLVIIGVAIVVGAVGLAPLIFGWFE